jgi:intein/homing endonuclease
MVLNSEGKLEECKTINLKIGDEFITLTGNSKVKSITKLEPSNNWVYDIQMKDNPHTFFGNGILVHNSVFLKVGTDKDKLIKWLDNFNNN